ncbi:Hypothetical predicted protein [Mytilus galloprovincialis]|uniref:Uncharacterized protein n=1 Tax=Mytilus galloprovincialis TaxID=29158 RepID=A0A8B6BIJ2_MYTGA|nr:Hypothetical predicted protein [Mytilus galloprovincialis]
MPSETRNVSPYLKVSSSDNSSTDLEEFLGMEGLQCGDGGEQFYRNGSIKSIQKDCFKEINLLFNQHGTSPFLWIKFSEPTFGTLNIDVICNTSLVSYVEHNTDTGNVNCSKKEEISVIVNSVFGVRPKDKQEEALEHLMKGGSGDLLLNLPVGYGKSLVYPAFPFLHASSSSLVIALLNIIQTEQLASLNLR